MKWKIFGLALLVLGASFITASGFAPGEGYRETVIKFHDEVWNKGNLAFVDEVMTPQIARFGHVEEGNTYGIEAYKQQINKIRSSFTDYNIRLLDMMGVDDTATFTWQLRGNYVGPNKSISPGRTVDIMGKTVWTMKNGKVIREVVHMDPEEYYRQIQMAQPYSEVENRALMLSYLYEVVSLGDMTWVDKLVSPKHVLHDVGNDTVVGPEALRQHILALRTAFPDLKVKIHEVIADGNSVSARWTLEGTQKGSWNDNPATDRKMFATGVTFMTVKDNKIQETWNSIDLLAVGAKPTR